MKHGDGRRVLGVVVPLLVGAAGVGLGVVLSVGMSGYLVFLGISAVIAAISILGLGVVTGRAGMIALCQLSFAAIGAWVVSGLNLVHAPGGYVTWLVAGALTAGAVGTLVGLPALRLRGINLAVVTLGFAAAVDMLLVQIQFPGADTGTMVLRPTWFSTDPEFFVFSVVVLTVCALAVHFLGRGRWGSGWKSVAFSERGTASVGASVPVSKLTAFAVSATLGGVSGGLIAGQVGLAFPSSFPPVQSLALYVLSVVAGAHFVDMAILGGILWVLIPELLKRWGISQDWGLVVFGALGVQALTSGVTPGGLIRDALWRRRGRAALRRGGAASWRPDGEAAARGATAPLPPAPSGTAAHGDGPARPLLTVRGLTVEFGAVKALDDVELTLHSGSIMGLIGPNGAGKSTFVDALTGFLPRHSGTITLDGAPLRSASATKRARLGLRRTFQQDRVPPTLTVGAYVRFVARRRLAPAEIDGTLEYFGCPPAGARLAGVDVGTRRLVEVAANVLARPKVLLLDEPAAGLSHEEHVELGERLRRIPERFAVAVVLIEHDLDMVREICDELTVLDFGKVIATGSHERVLSDPEVLRAYMGAVDDEAEAG